MTNPAPVPASCDGGCDPAAYWRQEAADARAEATTLRRAYRTAELDAALADPTPREDPTPGPCLDCRTGCPTIGGPCTVDPAPPRFPDTAPVTPGEMLAYEDAPAPMTTGERILGVAVLGPWSVAVVGWAWGVIANEIVRAVRGR